VRQLKGLQDFLPYTSVHWEMLEKGELKDPGPLPLLLLLLPPLPTNRIGTAL